MGEKIEKRLSDLGVTLPAAAAPAANYVPFVLSGNLLFTAGQLPLKDGKLQVAGLLGRDVDTAAGTEAAKLCEEFHSIDWNSQLSSPFSLQFACEWRCWSGQ